MGKGSESLHRALEHARALVRLVFALHFAEQEGRGRRIEELVALVAQRGQRLVARRNSVFEYVYVSTAGVGRSRFPGRGSWGLLVRMTSIGGAENGA